ncbi:MAG: UDP-N-acetylmuramoyl-tripeptide--D-alanyl-D-alanine ligase [Bacteroidota bacterium]
MSDQTKAILAHFEHFPSVTTDSRAVRKGDIFFALQGDRFNGNRYARSAMDQGASLVVMDDADLFTDIKASELNEVRAGQPEPLKCLVADGLKALQSVATAYRRSWDMPVLAITGSNGKTTTKELISAVMATRYSTHATHGNYNNHIGVPLTILATPKSADICILEMGANHQGEIAELCRIGEPSHGLITNIGQAHLEGFGGREGIKKGKGEMFDWLGENSGIGFVNLDQPEVVELGQKLKKRVEFGRSEAPSQEVDSIEVGLLRSHPNCKVTYLSGGGEHLTAETHLTGLHNFENIKAAIAVGKYFKVPGKLIASALESYRPDNARSQRLTHRNVSFFWDAYNANPTSVKAALAAFSQLEQTPKVAILGEMLELGEEAESLHLEVAHYALDHHIDQIVLVGKAFESVAERLDLKFFADSVSLSNWFWAQNWAAHFVFVKGSRGVALEKLLE